MTGLNLALTIVGGGMQVLGFALTLWELSRTQRREFPEHVPAHHRAAARLGRTWLGRKLGIAKAQAVILGPMEATAKSSATLGLSVGRGNAATLDERVRRLELELGDKQRARQEDRTELQAQVAQAERRTTELGDRLSGQISEAETKRKESLRESLLWERVGVVCFLVGVLLSVLGASV